MKMVDMIIISTDDHIIEPPDVFSKNMPAKWKAHAPRVARYADGQERWIIGDLRLAHIAAGAVAGRKLEEVSFEPGSYAEVRRAAYDVDARVDDMSANGILSALNFPNVLGFAGDNMLKVKDKDLALAVIQTYNDWHCDQWAGAYPGRFIPVAILPLWDVKLCVEEIRRVERKGVRVIAFPENPPGFKLPSIHKGHWDPVFKELTDRNMTVVIHIGTAGGQLHAPSMDSPSPVSGALCNIKIAESLADIVFSPLPQKFPTLRFALSEGCMGWVPFMVERMEASYRKTGKTSGLDLGKDTPRSIVDRQFLFCFHEDDFGVKNRHEIGIDLITVEVDYPHCDSTFPYTPEGLWRVMKDLPPDEVHKMTHRNAMRFFDFDPFKFINPKDATVGALRAQAKARNVDVTPKSYPGRAPQRSGDVMTSGDIARLFANMDAGLGEPVGTVNQADF
jgi:predicted TIM-barrel fold metal-dependent hydrolase